MKKKILDLFCGGGGAAKRYIDAGFDVTGIDTTDHSSYYPGKFIQADAVEFVGNNGGDYDAVHASPPCLLFSVATPTSARSRHLDLITPTRKVLEAITLPWVIENVHRAPLRADLTLCGSHFDLVASGHLLKRHRAFELSGFSVPQPVCSCNKWRGKTASATGWLYQKTGMRYESHGGTKFDLKDAQTVMGVNIPSKPLVQAIPAAYSRYIGGYLSEAIDTR